MPTSAMPTSTQTIPELILDVAQKYGRRPALGIRIGLRTEMWSYQDVALGMTMAAEGLRARGVQPGDRVMVLAPNSPYLVLSMLGAWAAGAILVPIDLRTPTDVMARIREQTDPRLILTDTPEPLPGLPCVRPAELAPHPATPAEAPHLPTPSPARGRGGGLVATAQPTDVRASLLGNGGEDACLPLSRVRERGLGGEGLPSPAGGEGLSSGAGGEGRSSGPGEGAPPGLAEIIFTSGTTGAPKGVMLTHANILANVQAARAALPLQVGERLLSLLPLSHMMEQTAGLLAALNAGATVYYATSRRSSAILAAFQRHQIGILIAVPEVLTLLLAGIEREVDRAGKRRAWELLNAAAARLPMAARPSLFRAVHQKLGGRFRMALCGGAPLTPSVQAAWERLGVRAIQGYGATECAPIITSNRYDHREPNTVGWPLPGVEVGLAGDGEVLVRGPNVTPGYWHDAAATEASFLDDWYRTGDLGEWVDVPLPADPARGEIAHVRALRLRGRKKEMIVLSDGRNVFPEDVEPALRADPAVKDCTVVGRPRGSGVEVHAVIIPADPMTGASSAEAAVRRANSQLGPQQQIGGWSVWPEPEFPRTPSLKIKRGEVLDALVEHHAPPRHEPSTLDADTPEKRLIGLLARATGRPAERIRPESDLHLDLGLDSLGRVELAVLLEEELGRSLSDEQVAELRTVGDLQRALEQPASSTPPEPLAGWPRWRPVRALRAALQDAIIFPVARLFTRPLHIEGREHLERVRGPALLIANHASHLDSVTVLAALPEGRRWRTAVAAAADYFFTDRKRSLAAYLALGAFPFHRTGPVAASLAHCGDLADNGCSLLVFPEGTRSTDGRIAPFKPGIGLLARELGLPVVPIYLDGLFQVLPKGRSVPRPGSVRVIIGAPLRVEPTLGNIEAAAQLEAALRALAPSSQA